MYKELAVTVQWKSQKLHFKAPPLTLEVTWQKLQPFDLMTELPVWGNQSTYRP